MKFEEVYDLYESEKREKRDIPFYYYNSVTSVFETFNDIVRKQNLTGKKYYYKSKDELYVKIIELGYAPFIDSYEICLKCMRKCLSDDKKALLEFERLHDGKNAMGERLHFLDRYFGGLRELEDTELSEVRKVIKKWCEKYNIVLD